MTEHKKSFRDGVQVAWDATSLDLAQTCLRKYYYTMIRGVKPAAPNVHLLFGGIYASALELFYKLRAEDEEYEAALRKVVRYALTDSWEHVLDETGEPIPGSGHAKPFMHNAKTRENLIRTIVWYLEEFGIESEDGPQTYRLANGKPAVELSFALELDDDILYCGHLDRVVDYGGHLYVMDQKTTGGTLSNYYFEQFNPSNQMTGYSWAGKVVLKSPVKGVIIDAAQIAVNFTRFERAPTLRTADQITEWQESARYTIKLAQAATHLNRFPMNATACGNYGGCPFRTVCSRPPKLRENYLKADFIEHNWDPIKER